MLCVELSDKSGQKKNMRQKVCMYCVHHCYKKSLVIAADEKERDYSCMSTGERKSRDRKHSVKKEPGDS